GPGCPDCPGAAPPWVDCMVLSGYTTAEVSGSNGFFQSTTAWDEQVGLQTSDPGPGQTMQPVTYTLTGTVVISYCLWSQFENDCIEEPQEYIEWGQTQVTVVPGALPAVDGLSPASGSGFSQTFTAQYSSAHGP